MEFRCITEQNIPCWYELSWQEKPPAIILRIHKDFIENLDIKVQDSPIVKSLKEDFNFKEFSNDFEGDIGFDKVFERTGEKDGFIEFLAKIPKVKKRTNEKCPHCNGTGYDQDLDRECFSCKGTGKDYIMDWHLAEAISASFSVFTTLLNWKCETDTSADFPQLLTVNTMTREGLHGGSLDGKISIPLRKWLSSFTDHANIPEMIQAMITAYNQMLGLRGYQQFSFQVYVRKSGGFIADCPGDACGIYPSDNWHMKEGEGYKFSCHNVDDAVQQITLLAGLAALSDKARKEIKA